MNFFLCSVGNFRAYVQDIFVDSCLCQRSVLLTWSDLGDPKKMHTCPRAPVSWIFGTKVLVAVMKLFKLGYKIAGRAFVSFTPGTVKEDITRCNNR